MDKMKHLDGVVPSTEYTEKMNEFVAWLEKRGFKGIMFLHKDDGDIGITWVQEMSEDSLATNILNSLRAVSEEAEAMVLMIVRGMAKALRKILK